ncbi:MAG: threonine synthase [Gammaproteobacteria bacterium]|nr:threonine synthase [Gammaproteobacteria bacterium]
MTPRKNPAPNFVTHLECSLTGAHYPANALHNLSTSQKPLLVRYDLEKIQSLISRDALKQRPPDLWRYRELLPITETPVSLGESATPILADDGAARALDLEHVWIKDEGRLPTGSFKARGLAMAVNLAKSLGVKRMAIPTNGNAGAALAAYCAAAKLEAICFCPEDTPAVNLQEMAFYGAKTFRVKGLINDCGTLVKQGAEAGLWFDTSTLKEPYRIEGKKTMGLELAEQLDWTLPDAIFYPTGGGTGLIGMWKAFDELQALGWIDDRRPRMFAIQSDTCAPIVAAFEAGHKEATLWPEASTVAAGIRVPMAIGDFLILQAIRDSQGAALAVSDEAILSAQATFAKNQGILLCPEGAATAAGLQEAAARGLLAGCRSVLLFNCATGLKYPMPGEVMDFSMKQPIEQALTL